MKKNSILLKDFYKVGHYAQYPKGTELVFSNFTPRKPLNSFYKYAVLFGLQYLIKEYLLNFINTMCNETEYRNFMKQTLNIDQEWPHIQKLKTLGYLPIEIYALPECSEIPFSVPALVIYNTHPDFYWVPNMLETLLSNVLWGPSTSATIASMYRKILDRYQKETSDLAWFVDYQAHDFSFRGLFGVEAAMLSGAAHLQYFKGTDTIPGILMQHDYYNRPYSCGTSVPATEHSVMSAGGKETEYNTYKRLITEIYPSGIVSIVSDTWDLWNVVDRILPELHPYIMDRQGKVVIRPDSGDPIKILCGDINSTDRTVKKGLIERLYEIFGGVINNKGYKQLDDHIGAIYGDSITLERAEEILKQLKEKGFASTNVVFGIGSYTYQYNTRDTFGWAMKATYCEIEGKGHAITKDPKTDNGTKKSHSGLLKVVNDNGQYKVLQNQTWEQFKQKNNELKLVFKNGILISEKENSI